MISQLRKIFHGKGHAGYKSKRAKEKFADSLIDSGNHCITLMLAPLAGGFLAPETVNMWYVVLSCVVFFCVALSLRHAGLAIIDDIDLGKISVSQAPDAQ